MSITPVSSLSSVQGPQPGQNPAVSHGKSSSSQTPTDTIELSAAAVAHLSGDADHDGDKH
jgi:hypothetical protein